MEQQGIPHTFNRSDGYQVYRVYLPSIEKLQPIQFSLVLEDYRSYNLTLQASQYTRQLDDGSYQLAIQAVFGDNDTIQISQSVFQSHIVGFNQSNGTVQIAEKEDENRSLRRSQNNFD